MACGSQDIVNGLTVNVSVITAQVELPEWATRAFENGPIFGSESQGDYSSR